MSEKKQNQKTALSDSNSLLSKLLPIILTVVVVILDQVSKALIVKYIPPYTIGAQFCGDFFRIIHVSNTGVAFSFGATWAETVRRFAFCAVPLVVIILVLVVYFRNKEFSKLTRWSLMGIVGGGLGNLIDRFFRAEGVVDFIDVKWFGLRNCPIKLFKMTRWPTFNIADSAVVVCGIILIVSFIVTMSQQPETEKKDK